MMSHTYHGTASGGDFLTLTVDPEALTITYEDLSNGQSATAPFLWNIDSSYTVNDPTGNLTFAYEIPGVGIVLMADKVGPNQDSLAMVAAMEAAPLSLAGLAGSSCNVMGLGTTAGGFQVGAETVTATSADTATYWPLGAATGAQQAVSASQSLAGAVADASGTYLTVAGGSSGNAYLFGAAGGLFGLDTPTGSLLATPQSPTGAFDPSWAGTYKAVTYQKVNAAMGEAGVESGIVSVNYVALVVTAAGVANLYDDLSDNLASGTLTPVAQAGYLYGGPGAPLTSPCNGLFTFRTTSGGVQQDFFCTFAVDGSQGAAVFSSFSAPVPWFPGTSTYTYRYGVGLLAP